MHMRRPISALLLATLLLSGCVAGRSAFSKAQKLETEGNLDAALVKYAEVVSANPEVVEYRAKLISVTDAAARAHFKKGEAHLLLKNYDDALREFQSASAIDPTHAEAKAKAEQVLRLRNAQTYLNEAIGFEKERKPREAMVAYRHVLEFQPENAQAKEAVERLAALKRQKLDGYELNLKSTKPITLKFRDAKLKEIFSILSQLSGINFVFDDAVKDVNMSLFLENASFQQAMEIITGMQKLGKKVLNESTIIIYPKTPDKIKQYEELFLQTFYLNKLDAKKAVNLVRTMLQVKKIYVNEELNALVIRDTPEVIEVTRKILEANDVPDAEVLLEVEVFEISKKNQEAFGLLLSNYAVSIAATPPDSNKIFADRLSQVTTDSTNGTTTTQAGPDNLLNFFEYNGYKGYLTVPNATFNFGKNLTNGETLANPKLRVKNREKAKFNVGTRVPITTTSSPSGGGVSVNVQYVDVGVKLNVEPSIQMNNEVLIKLGLEVSTIVDRDTVGTDQATTVVTIGTRNLDTVLSLKDGETSIIGGLITKEKSSSKDKISFLGDLPLLGKLFSNSFDLDNKSEVMLAITPRIVRGVTVPEADVAAFWSGREDEPSPTKPYSSFKDEELLPENPPAAAQPAPAAGSVVAPALAAPAARALPAVPAPPPVAAPVPAPAAPPAAAPVPAPAPAAAPEEQGAAPAGEPAEAAPAPEELPAAVPEEGPVPEVIPVPAEAAAAPVPAPGAPAPAPATGPTSAPAAGATPPAAAAPAAAAPAAARPARTPVKVTLSMPPTVKLNDQFTVQINASGAVDLYNAVMSLKYDLNKLQVVTQAEGPFLKQQDSAVTFQAFGDRKKGELWLSLSRVNAQQGAQGSGALATVTFKAIGAGPAAIDFGTANFSDKERKPIESIPFKSIVEVK